MRSLLKKINHSGLEGLEDPLNYRRVLFINNLSLVSSIVAFAVAILVAFEQLFPQFLVTLSGGLLFLLVIYFNRLKLYLVARTYFLFISAILLVVVSLVAFGQGRFNETENILIGFMAVSYLLYDGGFRYAGFFILYGVLIWLKFVKQQYIGAPYDLNFYLTIQNTTILSTLVFLFAASFRRSLMKAFVRLKSKDDLLFSMIDNVPLYIALLDTDKRYRMVNINYEKSFGKNRDEIIGSHISEVLPENILNVHDPMVEAALRGESPEFLEKTDMPDGTNFYAGGRYVPITSDNGEIIGVTVFVNDVTKLENAKNKLTSANKAKDRLFSIVAHDIRGPLDLFDTLLDYSLEADLSQEEFLEHQKKIKSKLGELRMTVNTLLEWARSQLDGINVRPKSTNINNIFNENVELYRELITQKKINFEVKIPQEINAWVDENHLKISLRNMIHNALKYTPIGGSIQALAGNGGKYVSVTLRDSGVGMDLEKINSILKNELQESASGTNGELGTGLGLSLSLGLLQKNNCKVKIESEVNKGTEICIDIPSK
ncbi:PAS domain S-box protein [Ekhidna sp.]|uniref:sensor histidine kinase n=1 Tax=Ekhidna sp. TaxID=2608089 RepID=UPI00351755DE